MGQNEAEGSGTFTGICDQYGGAGGDIADCHERHELSGNGADTVNTAYENEAGEKSKHHARRPKRHAERRFQRIRHRVGLDHVADAETGKTRKQGKAGAEPRPVRAHAIRDVVHGTADIVAVLIDLAVAHCEHSLGELGGHAHQGRHPHPEHRARPADEDRRGDTGDVARADGRRKSRHQGIERRDIALACGHAAAPQHPEGERHIPDRAEFQAERQKEADAEEQHQHGHAP